MMSKRLLLMILVLSFSLIFSSVAVAQDHGCAYCGEVCTCVAEECPCGVECACYIDTSADDDIADDDSADDDTADDDTADDDTADDDTADDDDAADDDDDFMNSTVEFTEPSALEADQQYEFMFTVTNNAVAGEVKGDWIYMVDLSMPSQDYVVSEEDLTAPDPLYGGATDDTAIDRWESHFDASSSTITWQAFGVVTSANYGDIREGDFLSFQFVATTDATPKDGFYWVLYSDEGPTVDGTAYITDESPGDDDTGDDDSDDDSSSSSSGDDDSGGCGC